MIIKKRIILISVIAALFAAMTGAYFIIAKYIKPETKPNNEIILMFPEQSSATIQDFVVSNSYGTNKFIYDETNQAFLAEGYFKANYNRDMLGLLVADVGYARAITRVTDNAEDLTQYGLDESNNPAYYTLTTKSGAVHKVYIGNMIPTGAGYYARCEGENIVYVLEASISQTLLGPIENLMSPMLFKPFLQTDYFKIKDFTIVKYDIENAETTEETEGEVFIQISTETKIEKDENGKETEKFVRYKITHPTENTASENVDGILQSFMQLEGYSVVACAADDEELFNNTELLKKYKLDTPAYELMFEHNNQQNYIYISPKNEDGTYYAYSMLFETICVIAEEDFAFLEWDFNDFVQEPIFQYDITDITSVKIESKDFNDTFILYFSEGETTTNPMGQTVTKNDISVKLKSTGTYIPDPDNFRGLYMVLLTINQVEYDETIKSAEGEFVMRLEIQTKQGETLKYEFFSYSESGRRCYFTLNGNRSELYVIKEKIVKVINDANRVVNGEKVDYLARY